jgi:hypothetical protein
MGAMYDMRLKLPAASFALVFPSLCYKPHARRLYIHFCVAIGA